MSFYFPRFRIHGYLFVRMDMKAAQYRIPIAITSTNQKPVSLLHILRLYTLPISALYRLNLKKENKKPLESQTAER